MFFWEMSPTEVKESAFELENKKIELTIANIEEKIKPLFKSSPDVGKSSLDPRHIVALDVLKLGPYTGNTSTSYTNTGRLEW